MKTFTVILLALFLNPVTANESISLYEKSGGYETSGGYERSSGYEKSGEGYNQSEGYDNSVYGYQKSEVGYTPYTIESPVNSKRIDEQKYNDQIIKTKIKRDKWIAERHNNEGTINRIRGSFHSSGGTEDLVE